MIKENTSADAKYSNVADSSVKKKQQLNLKADLDKSKDIARLGLGNHYLPIDFLRPELQQLINDMALDFDVHRDKVVMAVMMTVAAAVGKNATLRTPSGYINHPALMSALVDEPGAGKSYINREIFKPLIEKDNEIRLNANKKIKDEGLEVGDYVPPVRITYNTTTERLLQFVEHSPGVLENVDELTRFFADQGKYSKGKGGDFQTRMELFNGSLVPADRKGDKMIPVATQDISYNLYGTIQPSRIKDCFGPIVKNRDGGFPRILFVVTPFRPKTDNSLMKKRKSNPSDWKAIVDNLYNIPTSQMYDLSNEAASAYDNFVSDIINDYNKKKGILDDLGLYRQRNGQQILRICLILHLLNNWEEPYISEGEMEMAIGMMKVFNKNAESILELCEGNSNSGPSKPKKYTTQDAIRDRYKSNNALGYPASHINQKSLTEELGCSPALVSKIKKEMLENGEIFEKRGEEEIRGEVVSKEDAIRDVYIQNANEGNPASSINQSELAKSVGCSQVYVNQVKKKMIDAGELSEDPPKIEGDSGTDIHKSSNTVDPTS